MVEQSNFIRGAPADGYLATSCATRRSFKIPVSFGSIGVFLAAFDALAIFSLGLGNSALYNFLTAGRQLFCDFAVAVGLIGALLFCLLMQTRGLYRPARILNQARAPAEILNVWLMTSASVLTLGFLVRASADFSRGAAVCFFLSGAAILPASRILAKRLLAYLLANNLLQGRRSVVLLGEAGRLASYGVAERLRSYGYNVVGHFGANPSDSKSIAVSLNQLSSYVKTNRVDEIFLAFDGTNRAAMQAVSQRLLELPIPVRMLFDHHLDRLLSLPIVDLGAAKAVKLQGGPLNPSAQFLKRSFDVTLASVGLFLLAPLFVIVALAIKLDSPGPVIFRQRRVGFSGRIFQIYKFRSMTTLDDGAAVLQATRNDRRVTRVGRYIRHSSLDELPQLLNVLRGEMSIVGPRPHALSHDDEYTRSISTYALRHHMKPGITGWAQVNGCRGETPTLTSMEQRVKYDIWYIKHWSLLLDVRAVAKTIGQMAFPKNVY